MVAEFWPEVAPNTVENLEKLAPSQILRWHSYRIVKGFMEMHFSQRSGKAESAYGTGDPGYKIEANLTIAAMSAVFFPWRARAIPIRPAANFICLRM